MSVSLFLNINPQRNYVVVLLSIVSLVLIIIAGVNEKTLRSLSLWAGIALAMMFVGAIGTSAVPTKYFGIVERFSVFAAVGFNAVLGISLFFGFQSKNFALFSIHLRI